MYICIYIYTHIHTHILFIIPVEKPLWTLAQKANQVNYLELLNAGPIRVVTNVFAYTWEMLKGFVLTSIYTYIFFPVVTASTSESCKRKTLCIQILRCQVAPENCAPQILL